MPCIILCGFPCSGKSKRSEELRDYFRSFEYLKTVIVSDEKYITSRNDIYKESTSEKNLRSDLKSEVQRQISKDTIVILDASNYIKGYRYELYCLTKSLKTTQCIVHCDVSAEIAWQWNTAQKSISAQYEKEIFDGLVQRFESPDSRNRWDSPLFLVHQDESIPFEAIKECLLTRKPPPPNQSTQTQPLSATSFLYELDIMTQQVTQIILEAQKNNLLNNINVPGSSVQLNLSCETTPAALTRLRRQFITYTKTHPIEDVTKISTMFVHYLNSSVYK